MGSSTRQDKVEWMQNAIGSYLVENPKKYVSKKRLVARCAMLHSCTPRTALEIIKILEDATFIVVKGDEITKWSPKKI